MPERLPLSADCNNADPVGPFSELPVDTSTSPPAFLVPVAAPPTSDNFPTPSGEDPTAIVISPLSPAREEPEAMRIAPESPSRAEPLSRDMPPLVFGLF